MALDPLRFAIEIVDDASQKIKAIKEELNKLEPKIKVTFDESSINVAQLRTALENAIKSLGEIKVSGAGINISGDALGGAADKISEAKEAIKGERFGELAKRINEATTELERLTVAFQNFHMTVGQDKGLKDFMTGLGEVISNVKTQLGALDKVSNSESSLTKIAEKVETNKRRFNELLESAGKLKTELASVDAKALDLNMDNPSMRNSLKVLNDYIAKLREMRENPGAIDYKSDHQIKELIAQFNRLKTTLTEVSTEQQKLNRSVSAEGARDDANAAKEARQNYEAWVESIRRATVEHTKLAITIAQLEDKERRASGVGVNTKDLKDQIAGLKQYKDTLKEIADGSKQHGLAKDFVRRADVESAIMLAKREGEVIMQNARAREQSDKQMLQGIKQAEDNQQRYNKVLAEAVAMQERLMNAGNKGTSLGLDTSKIDDASIKLQQYIDKLLVLDKTQFGAASRAEWKTLEASLKSAAAALEKLNAATEKQKKKDAEDDRRKQAKENDDWAKSMAKAGEEANKLGIQIRKLQAIQKEGDAVGADTSKLRTYISQLDAYRGILESINQGYKTYGHTGPWLTGQQTLVGVDTIGNTKRLADEASESVKKETRELERNQSEKQKSASSTSQLTAEEQRLAQALNQTTEHARGQSQVLSDLKSMAMQYLGVWGGQQFLHNIIEIGGQLEMQRLSIGAILSNQSQANDLFEKIKGLAVQSPFGVVELDQMTKQLTAYGFKYNELFDMTKRLADISAATGTGVDRLALALGHVRSEAALSGYTLRQFSMANVPLLAKLSEKLGKTTQEIRKMVRAKEVSYEDVVGVLKDITNEGGMFYQMQEVISSSVKAKFKNVKDAMDIMYGEMAEGYIGDSLKGVAEALMEVTRNWKDAATVLGTGAALWAAHRVAAMAYATTLGKTNAAVLASIAAHNKQEAAVLSLAGKYRVLTVTEQERLAASKKNVVVDKLRLALGRTTRSELEARDNATKRLYLSDLQLAMSEKKLTVEGLARLVATGKVTKAEALQIITNLELADSGRMLAAQTIMGTKRLGMFRMGLLAVGNAAKGVALALKAIMFNPAMLGMAAITGLVELWQRNNAEMERAKELGDAIFEASQEGLKNARTMMQSTGIEAYQFRDGKLANLTNSFGAESENKAKTFLVKPEFDPSTAQQIIDEWSQYIREYSGNPNKMLNDALVDEAGNVRMLKDQFDHLYLSVEQVIKSQKGLADIADIFQMAQESTGSGWLNEDIVEDVKDYDKALRSFNKTIITTFRNNGRAVKSGIDAAREFDANFAKNTEGMSSYGDMLKELVENYEKYGEAVRRFNGADYGNENLIEDIIGQRGEVRGARKEMQNELDQFISGITSAVEAGKIKLDDSTKNGLMAMFEEKFIGSLGNISEEAKKELRKRFADAIGFVIDDAEEITEKRLADWQVRAGKVFEINKEIKVKTKTITDISEFAKAVQEDLKKKQDYIKNNASHINHVLNLKTSLKLDASSLNDQIIALSSQVQKLVAQGKIEAAKSLNSIIQDELLPYRDAMMAIEENKKWLKSEGYPETEAAKDKPKNKNTGSKEDKNAKAVRERVRILKEAADAFEYWNKKLGQAGAWERVNEQFGDVLSKIGVTIDNIEDLRGHLKAVSNSKEYKAIKDQKVKLEIDKEIARDLDQLNRKVFEKSIDEYKSKFTKTLDDLTRRWETFNAVRQATGSKAIALDIAGISEQDRGLRNAADAMRRKLVEEMRNAGGDSIVTAIPLDVYIDEEKLRDQFKSVLGDNDEQAMKIDGLVEAYKRWQKAQQDVTKADIDAYAKIIGSVVDYTSRIDRINDKLEQEKENIEALVALYNKSGGREGISQDDADTAIAILMAKANFDKLKEGSDYINLMNRSLSMTKGEVTAAASAIEDSLNERLAAGVIKAEEYATEMKKLHDIVAKFDENSLFGSNSALTSFLSGGLKGSQSFVNDRIVSLTIKSNQEGLSEDEQNELDGLIELRKKLDSAISKLSGFAAALQVVTGALDGFHKAAQSLSEMFDALGKEGPASFWGDIADGISAVSSIFEPANNLVQNALSGNIGGVLSSAISAPVDMITGPITAFAKLHDKRLERAIERLREDVKSIEANTELIVRSRERTLGYDMGDVRRQMAQQYAQQSYGGSGIMAYINAMLNGSKQNKSMFEYYSQNSQGTGYQQEYGNLVEQREKYMEILKDQQNEKKKSYQEIEETKSKIAELDDQIRYFTQDLAKELWGIDIKGWADQLSDALASAFENGENMAKAYRDTVTSILQQMMQKMMQMQILEPMFANLQKDLFGENGKGGVFDTNNPKGSLSKVTKIIGDYFGKGGEGEKAITASMEFMTAFQRGMQNAGLTVLNEASNTLSSSMQGTTEETSGLLAGYVNALRQDVSVNRILLTQYVTQLWPQYIEAYTAQVTSVASIDNNVRIIMEMMQMGNGAMYDQIAAMRARFDNIVLGIDSVSVK